MSELCGAVAVFAITLTATVQLARSAPEDKGALILAHLPAHVLLVVAILVMARFHGAAGRAALGLSAPRPLRRLGLGLAAYVGFLVVWVPLVFFGYARLLEA